MTLWTLAGRSLRFHLRTHAGVVLGAVVGSAALTGALLVGDSVRESLREHALRRLQNINYVMATGDRFFQGDLAQRMEQAPGVGAHSHGAAPGATQTASTATENSTALLLSATAARPDASARANRVQIVAVDPKTWPDFASWQPALSTNLLERWRAGTVVLLNETLARQLSAKPGDQIILRIRKPSALALDAVITPRNDTSLALPLEIGDILPAELLGDFDLSANQVPAANAFLPLDYLAQKLELPGRANLLVFGPTPPGTESEWLSNETQRLDNAWSLADAQLSLTSIDSTNSGSGPPTTSPAIQLTTARVFLDSPVINAAFKSSSGASSAAPGAGIRPDNLRSVSTGISILTYLANLFQAGNRATPYSMVTAAGPPFTQPDMRDDEILVNDWLAQDLQLKPGDSVDLSYYLVDSGSRLVERTNSFRVRKVLPIDGLYGDRSLMPDFPGIAKAESTHDWDTGFPLVYKIREKDEAYWKAHRGTPKAFITLGAGQEMWANRFGSLTAIRYQATSGTGSDQLLAELYRRLQSNLAPADLGFRFQPVRQQALLAAQQSQDFGQLFLAFSLFLVVAALLLMALLFQLGLEQRAQEIGTFLALGYTARQVRRLLLLEGAALALVGGLVGVAAGWAYAKALLWALTTVWKSAVGAFPVAFYATPLTIVIGLLSGSVIALMTIWLTLRKQARRPAYELLTGATSGPIAKAKSRGVWVGALCAVAGLTIVGWALAGRQLANPEAFFGAGSLLLIAGLSFASFWLTQLARSSGQIGRFSTERLAVSGCARRHKRSLATIALLACGCFVIVSLGAFRLDANLDAVSRSSGTGGFALFGQSTLPIVQDLNTQSGREFFGVNPQDMAGVEIVPFRVRQGDDASCLNLNHAQKPQLLGVRPESLAGRFSFAGLEPGHDGRNGWALLKSIGAARGETSTTDDVISAIGDANSIEWALGKKIGDTLDYVDERGHNFKLRLVGAVANSVLQGSLIIDETQFVKRFPSESGYGLFLIDAPSNSLTHLAATLSRALQDSGLELTPTVQRLNAFNAVQNTYLATFQILGGLGLLLGSAGLGVVVLRNVLERRGELALLLAVGFRRRGLRRLVLAEHGVLLAVGLSLGLLAGAIAVLPSLLSSAAAALPYASLGMTLVAILVNGALWTWLATRFALRGNLLAALRNE